MKDEWWWLRLLWSSQEMGKNKEQIARLLGFDLSSVVWKEVLHCGQKHERERKE
jgi:hypothetical protein